MGLWSAADDLLKGAKRTRQILDPSNIPPGPSLSGINFSLGGQKVSTPNYGDTIDAAARTIGKTPETMTIGDVQRLNRMYEASGGSENGFGALPSVPQFDPVSLPAPQRQNMGRLNRNAALATGGALSGAAALGYAGSQGAFDDISFDVSFDDVMAGFGTPSAPTATPQVTSSGNSIANRTRRNNVTPAGDNVVIVEPDPVASSAATPQVTDRDFDYAVPSAVSTSAPTSAPTSVPAASIAAGSDSAGTWTPEYGDTLWSYYDGDKDKIEAFAKLNNLKNIHTYLADHTYQTPSQSYLNNYLSQR